MTQTLSHAPGLRHAEMTSVERKLKIPRFRADRNHPHDSQALRYAVSHGFHDLSHQIQLLGDYPAARGTNASIWLGILNCSTHVAVKLLDPAPKLIVQHVDYIQHFIHEAKLWSRAMHHENVIPLLGVAGLHGSVALISPWMKEGNLSTYLKNHPDTNPEQLFADIARGLAYLHNQGIVYGFLQPSTILVSDMGRAYLSSFLFASREHESFDTPAGDVFAFGTTLIESLIDNTSSARSMTFLINGALQGKLRKRPHFIKGLTEELWIIVQDCWKELDGNERPTMAEVACRMVQLTEASRPLPNPILPARTLNNISAEVKRLGEHPIAGGGYCDLYLGERLGSEMVALKLVRLFGSTEQDKDAARNRLLNEAHLWAQFQHPRILEFYGTCDYGDHSLFMVSPFLKNGNIRNYLWNVNPNADRHRLLAEAAEGILYLHDRDVVHGDLKGSNILISDKFSAVLADFGLSRISYETTMTNLKGSGSPRWMAPELILARDNPVGPLKTQKSDVYAFGHVILEVLGDKLPFPELKDDIHVIVEMVRGGRSPRPDGPVADRWLNNAVWAISRQCTAVNPNERPGIETVLSDLRCLRHYLASQHRIGYRREFTSSPVSSED